MNTEKILKKLQKKQRMLLKVLLTNDIDISTDNESRLARIASGLRLNGIVHHDRLSLTSDGRAFVEQCQDVIFDDFSLNEQEILDKLLLVRYVAKPLKPVSKIERLFLIFLVDGPVNVINMLRQKDLLPRLRSRGYITGSDDIYLTEAGLDILAQDTISEEERKEALARFFTNARVVRKEEIESKAEMFISLYRHGSSYEEIGRLHNITRERVRQILNCSPRYSDLLAEHKLAKRENSRRREILANKESRLIKLEKSLANQFPDHVDTLWDQDKNIGLDPTTITAHSTSVEIWWKCPKDGHSWKKKPSDIVTSWVRSKTSGCPRCAGKTRKPSKQPTLSESFPEIVKLYWNFEKNSINGLDPNILTLASNYSASFKCPHDKYEWESKIHSLIKQQWSRGNAGCKVCNGTVHRRKGDWGKAGKLSEEFPEQVASLWNTERNGQIGLLPSELTIGSAKEAWFRCPLDGYEWKAKISAIRKSWENGRDGCPACYRPYLKEL